MKLSLYRHLARLTKKYNQNHSIRDFEQAQVFLNKITELCDKCLHPRYTFNLQGSKVNDLQFKLSWVCLNETVKYQLKVLPDLETVIKISQSGGSGKFQDTLEEFIHELYFLLFKEVDFES